MASDVIAQYNWSVAIIPSDTVSLERPSDALYVGGPGVVTVAWENGRTAAFTCVAGQILPFKAVRVNATGTTATLLHALYRV